MVQEGQIGGRSLRRRLMCFTLISRSQEEAQPQQAEEFQDNAVPLSQQGDGDGDQVREDRHRRLQEQDPKPDAEVIRSSKLPA